MYLYDTIFHYSALVVFMLFDCLPISGFLYVGFKCI